MTFQPMQFCPYCEERKYALAFTGKRCEDCWAEAARGYQAGYKERHPERVKDQQRAHEIKHKAKRLLRMAKVRADRKQLPFDLFDHRDALIARIDAGVCEMTGIPFQVGGGYNETWNSPSLDRREPKLGYVYSNVRVILCGLNRALGEWGEDRLIEMVEALRAT